ncbi:MAG: hypothetical protein J3Q66DRAFT_349055 [Benniella sp.]|nr:MAG: hypothetical protein J3Q66DRAFT_349055 [Benniella sp.]
MQFKSLAIALAVVAAAVSAQTVTPDACSTCAKASVVNEPTCKSLPPATQQEILAIFATEQPDLVKLAEVSQDVAIKTCLCRWATGTFEPTGAAASCTVAQGATPAACSAAQIKEGEAKIAPLTVFVQCASLPPATPAPGAPAPGAGAPGGGNGTSSVTSPSAPAATTPAAGGSTAAASMMTVSKAGVALAAVVGMAAMAGL